IRHDQDVREHRVNDLLESERRRLAEEATIPCEELRITVVRKQQEPDLRDESSIGQEKEEKRQPVARDVADLPESASHRSSDRVADGSEKEEKRRGKRDQSKRPVLFFVDRECHQSRRRP